MTCAGCGFDSPADSAFCPKCGRKLQTVCAGCGTASPPDYAFCRRCGATLGDVAPPPGADPPGTRAGAGDPSDTGAAADRRPATILFADLVGFTSISEQLDPEDVRSFQQDLFREMRAAIEAWDGFVEKYVGDAVMAVFGAPVAHEDDPDRALRAATEMHVRMAAIDARWSARFGRPIALRIGINTGAVVAGRLGGPGAAYAVTGDAVNTASRLQSAAQAGQTLVSRATQALARDAWRFEPLEPLELKGKTERVAVYRLAGAASDSGAARGLASIGIDTPMIGRAAELDALVTAFDRALQRHAQVVHLVGEAGAGKTRLLDEFLERLRANDRLGDAHVRRTASASAGEQPYGVIATFCRQGFGLQPDDPLPIVREKLATGLRMLQVPAKEAAYVEPVLGYVLGLQAGTTPSVGEPETVQRQIFLLLRMLFERRLGQGPVIVIVENLQWTDAASIEGLRTMADWMADQPLLMVFASRPGFDARRLKTDRAAQVSRRIEPLATQDCEAILEYAFGASRDAVPAWLRDMAVRRAGGNPLYLEEIVRDLVAGGTIVREGDAWRCTASATMVRVPTTLHAMLLARVDRLPAAPRLLLQEAAVLGAHFDEDVLRQATATPAALDASFTALREAAYLSAERGGAAGGTCIWSFAQSLMQEVVYENILIRRRTEQHARIARVLEARHGSRPERLEDLVALGHHYARGEERLKGARTLIAAGDWARGIYANDDAIRHYRRALETLRDCTDCEDDALVAQERMADVLALVGKRHDAVAGLTLVCERARARGAIQTTARILRKLAGLHWELGSREQGLACLDEGLTLLAGEDASIELAQLYQERGRLAFRGGDYASAVQWGERALAQAEHVARDAPPNGETRAEVAAAISHALNTVGAGMARLGRAEEAVTHVERAAAVALDQGLLHVACRAYANLAVLYSQLNPGRAIETCLAGLDAAKKIGDPGFQSRLYANLAVAYCALTNQCDIQGVRAAQAAIDLDRRLGQVDHLAVPLIVLGQIYQCHGEPGRARALYEEALELAGEAGEPQILFPCYDGLGTLYLEKGNEELAERYLLKAEAICDQAGVDRDSLVVLPFLC
jgi:adenylate cyclase